MFKPVKMSKIRAICLKAAAPDVIKTLHNLSVLHITDSLLPELERSGPLSSYDDISKRLVKIRTIIEALPKGGRPPKKKASYEDLLAEADSLIEKSEQAFTLTAERESIAKELDTNLASQKSLSDLESLEINFSELSASSLSFFLLRVQKDKEKMAREILSATKNCIFSFTRSKTATSFVIAIPRQQDSKFMEGFGQVSPLPQITSTPKKEISHLKQKESALREKTDAIGNRLSRLGETLYPQAVALEEALSIDADRAQIATFFGASSSLYFIQGWVEEFKFQKIKAELTSRFGRKLHVSSVPHSHDEAPPTLLNNPLRARPFEYLVEFISMPQYSEIDPTMILAIVIPIMYALIMGDAGYALISFIFALWLVIKSEKGSLLNQVALIWVISAIPAFVAGIVFDEYFGFTHTHLFSLAGFGDIKLYEGMHRVTSINTLMLMSIFIGMAHLSLGFIIGAANEWHHSKKHAAAKICWLLILLFGFMTIASMMYGIMPEFGTAFAAILGLSIVGLILTEGIIAAVEIPGLLGNVMSYLRIAAVGVGGVIIAEAINVLLMPKFELTPVGFIVFVITAIMYIAMHLASCMLAMFESLVHGARLNVVEFFGKFYRGGGSAFSPFSVRRVHTQEA